MFNIFQTQVLSADDCKDLIALGMSRGFEKASVNIYGKLEHKTNIRNNERIEFDDEVLAQKLESVLLSTLQDFPYTYRDMIYKKTGSRFRMYKYTPGQFFKPHKDGSFQSKEQKSLITVLFYLNDTEGGETILMPDGFSNKESWNTIKPMEGSVLLFDHNFWHEGRPVTSGEKFVLRTDLFYAE